MHAPPPALTLLAVVGLASLQGGPRRGALHLGIPLGGALEPARLRAANRAIENPDEAVAIELCGALTLRLSWAPTAGGAPGGSDGLARLTLAIDGARFTLRPGETLTVPGDQPVRYIALPGGASSPAATGRFGTLPGDWLHAGDTVYAGRHELLEPSPEGKPARLSSGRLLVTRGPDPFPDEAWRLLLATHWRVGSTSRVGTRLLGPPTSGSLATGPLPHCPLAHSRHSAVRGSHPMLPGFIEVPPDGQPIVLGPDHPVTGGYPVIGTLQRPLGARTAGDALQFESESGGPPIPALGEPRAGICGCFAPFQGQVRRQPAKTPDDSERAGNGADGGQHGSESGEFKHFRVACLRSVRAGPTIPLNIDLGELPDEDPALYELADIANIACGGHAGDEASMRRVLEAVARHGGRVAAHPSYPDRANFGRVAMSLTPGEIEATVREQCAALRAVADHVGIDVFAVKPHGALYHAAIRDPAIAEAIRRGARAALSADVVFIGMPGGWVEGFADRGVLPDGRLIPRGQPGDLLTDPSAVARRAATLAEQPVDTICVHGDTPGAVQLAEVARAAILRTCGTVVPFRRIPLSPGDDRAALCALWRDLPGVQDIAFGDDSALVIFTDGPVALPRTIASGAAGRACAEHSIEVRYDGVDLNFVAEATGLSIEQVIALHVGATYTVAYPGFLPGFAYLDGLPEELKIPRRATPRPVVPAGSVAIAEGRTAVYPSQSPGGWHILGTVEPGALPLFDREEGPRLRTGERVTFVQSRM